MKMKIRNGQVIALIISVGLLSAISAPAETTTKLMQRGGSKMRLEGTSTAHDWRCESGIILGSLEVGPNFPLAPGQKVTPGKVEAKGEAKIKVTSLKSKNKDGTYYDDKMDDKMYNMMSYTNHPDIIFKVTDLTLKEAAKDANSPYLFDAKGDLSLAGVTNNISFPVKVMPLPEKDGENRVKISGEVPLKMSQFKISPAQILFVKTADDVKAIFDWVVGVKKSAGEKK